MTGQSAQTQHPSKNGLEPMEEMEDVISVLPRRKLP